VVQVLEWYRCPKGYITKEFDGEIYLLPNGTCTEKSSLLEEKVMNTLLTAAKADTLKPLDKNLLEFTNEFGLWEQPYTLTLPGNPIKSEPITTNSLATLRNEACILKDAFELWIAAKKQDVKSIRTYFYAYNEELIHFNCGSLSVKIAEKPFL
jgi:hypothetical protein